MKEQSLVHRLHDLTYPRVNLNDHALDDNLPSSKSQPESECLRLPPRTNVGVLDALPPELLQKILSQPDLRTLTDFRRINRRVIDILSIKTGRWITCRTLYEKLCTPGCEQCGDFGSYLYLLTCKRVCFLCFSQDRLYLPLSPRRASWKVGLDSQIINTLPRMRVIRGTYSPNVKRVAMHKYVADMETQKLQAHNARVAAVQQSGSITRRMRQPRTSDPFDGQSGNPFRFVAIVQVPWLNRSLQEVIWAFHCVGRKFTAASFDDHLKQFGNIQNWKHHLC
ncbi:hypothetical protein BKA67DRAFT_593057 [Truncatella angustata]|uniref:F-box domain-containing protein n=1 Tax=Truncatella angustata TaxID=152316 RepID=A0A9P8ZWE8_9PEZI|nr:uncharacterized protein BKA67DRAFT_593057 [Truncatella angustata]KAH6652892.1 hypothetical protein BKA67DRAFT_593057 [Truncatella angustata]